MGAKTFRPALALIFLVTSVFLIASVSAYNYEYQAGGSKAYPSSSSGQGYSTYSGYYGYGSQNQGYGYSGGSSQNRPTNYYDNYFDSSSTRTVTTYGYYYGPRYTRTSDYTQQTVSYYDFNGNLVHETINVQRDTDTPVMLYNVAPEPGYYDYRYGTYYYY